MWFGKGGCKRVFAGMGIWCLIWGLKIFLKMRAWQEWGVEKTEEGLWSLVSLDVDSLMSSTTENSDVSSAMVTTAIKR